VDLDKEGETDGVRQKLLNGTGAAFLANYMAVPQKRASPVIA